MDVEREFGFLTDDETGEAFAFFPMEVVGRFFDLCPGMAVTFGFSPRKPKPGKKRVAVNIKLPCTQGRPSDVKTKAAPTARANESAVIEAMAKEPEAQRDFSFSVE